MIKLTIPLLLLLLTFGGCAGLAPPAEGGTPEREQPPSSGSKAETAIPATEWTVRNMRQLTARLDIAWQDEGESRAVFGITFTNTVRDPQEVSAVLLIADGDLYPLAEPAVLYMRPEAHELRIASVIPRETLLTVLNAESLYLIAALDGVEYQFEPEEDFANRKNRFLQGLNRYEGQ
jgi:hypothetical protein